MKKRKRKLKNFKVKSKGNKNLNILKDLFWDYKWRSVVKNLASPFVIARVLEIGNKEQVKTLISCIGDEKIMEFLKTHDKLLTKLSRNFWKLCYGIKEKEVIKET